MLERAATGQPYQRPHDLSRGRRRPLGFPAGAPFLMQEKVPAAVFEGGTMKRVLIVVAVAIATLVLCAPAFAGPSSVVVAPDHISWWHPAHTFTAVGKVQAVDTANGRLVMRVWLASVGVQRFLGEDLTVVIKPDTQLLRAHAGKFRVITLADVALGDHVRVTGTIDRSMPRRPSYIAGRVVARTVVPPEALKWFAFRGPVKSVDAAAGTLVARARLVTRGLWDVVGTDTTFAVAPTARIVTWRNGQPVVLTLADVVAGDRVLAQGSIDRTDSATPVFTIHWMRVWEPAPAAMAAP
jgi:hypothetical protein